jgi:formamidopyrimidine-DNA glycosylase
VPEGHTLHRLAAALDAALGGAVVTASSPQGRFAAGAALLDGSRLVVTDAHGKHLLVGFAAAQDAERSPGHWLHLHLGLYGTLAIGEGEPPPVRGALRLRLIGEGRGGPRWADLRGPTACELLTEEGVALLRARLGPDPLRADADPQVFVDKASGARTPVGAVLMHQDVIAGVGNIYRAEVLYRAGLDPYTPGREVGVERLQLLWQDQKHLLEVGLRTGRILTTEPEHRTGSSPRGREGDHYVYGRTGMPCRLCGAPIATAQLEARALYWCPHCQAPGAGPPFDRRLAA